MKIIFITLLCIGTALSQANTLDQFVVSGGDAKATFTVKQVAKMLSEGRTCVKKGRKILYKSNDLTKGHCKASKRLNLRVIKVSQLPLSMYNKIMGITALSK
jgi:hypothetical protein